MTPRIGVFPASGGLGSSIVNHLSKLTLASQLTLIARNPSKWDFLGKTGATLRHADYDQPTTLDHAFDNIDILMLISYASIEIEHRTKVHKQAIDSAVHSGVKHIFYSSLGFGGDLQDHSLAHVMGAHLNTEAYLNSISNSHDVTYTAVREGIYSESFPIYTAWFDLHNPQTNGGTGDGVEISIPHDGSGPGIAWVKRDELGEASAKLIQGYAEDAAGFKYSNRKVLLSGSRAISIAETVEILGSVIGLPLRIREISVDEYATLPQIGDRHTYHGVDLSREWATAWEAIKAGETAVVTEELGRILGREPEGFEVTIRKLVR